ncbi:MAG TPA: aldose epimerase family protein [Prolixibacteraceae bacterium]|nr:aldose epimerase family protein [Prolixibacteraceae bacterium]
MSKLPNNRFVFTCIAGMFLLSVSCSGPKNKESQKMLFEKEINGKQVTLFTLENSNGVKVTLTNYGGKIVNFWVPDRNGKMSDISLGFNTIDEYLKGSKSFGATVGRYANRIAKATFTLDSVAYHLPVNNGPNCIHGGPDGFYSKVFDAKPIETPEGKDVEMHYVSPDGENGFPGTLDFYVSFKLTDKNELVINYKATTDKATVLNVTNHSYFNLKGEGKGEITGMDVVVNGDSIAEVANSEMIPTGIYRNIVGTTMDFKSPRLVSKDIDADYDQLKYGGGYDHAWILNKSEKGELSFAASAYEPESGRFMEVFTTEPSVQFFTGNSLNGSQIGKSGIAYAKRTGFCFETQHLPDSPNHPNFPTTVLRPGETFNSTTIYKFSVK